MKPSFRQDRPRRDWKWSQSCLRLTIQDVGKTARYSELPRAASAHSLGRRVTVKTHEQCVLLEVHPLTRQGFRVRQRRLRGQRCFSVLTRDDTRKFCVG